MSAEFQNLMRELDNARRHATTPRGRLTLDDGAVAAVVQRRMSLLPAGIIGVSGEFYSGEPVDLTGADGVVVGRGLVAYDAADLPGLLGRRTADLPTEFRREVVHRDDLVVLPSGRDRPVRVHNGT